MKVRTYKPGSWNWKEPKVQLHDFDSWNADYTLAVIAAPLLKQLYANNHGFMLVEDCDVPPGLRSEECAPAVDEWELDDNAEARSNYVMEEIIWALEYIVKDEFQPDVNKLVQEEERCSEGCRLFGKYFRSLWD